MTLTAADFAYIRTLVQADSAIVLENDKEYLVESRLTPVVHELGAGTIAELVGELRRTAPGALRDRVVDAMTTNETSFFRDDRPFHALADVVLPELISARRPRRALDVWCAAGSSGQEAYSIAMLLDEALVREPRWRVRVLASDISSRMLEQARAGTYSQLEVGRGLPAYRLARHFRREGAQWRVRDRLRSMVECRLINLDAPWPALPQMDLILLRNVLIYFDAATRRRVLDRVRTVLRPDGYLFLGAAETMLQDDDVFERVQVGEAVAYRPR